MRLEDDVRDDEDRVAEEISSDSENEDTLDIVIVTENCKRVAKVVPRVT